MARPRSPITAEVLSVYRTTGAVLTWRTVADELVIRNVIGEAPAELELVRIAVRCSCQRGELVPAGAMRGAGRTRPPMGYRIARPDEIGPARQTAVADRCHAVAQMLLAWG
jgi:hypothetical protein